MGRSPDYAYTELYQYLLSRGVGVLAPNIRGSTGYGISYQKRIHRDWGRAELEDVRHAAEYLRTLECVDASRLASSEARSAASPPSARSPAYLNTGRRGST